MASWQVLSIEIITQLKTSTFQICYFEFFLKSRYLEKNKENVSIFHYIHITLFALVYDKRYCYYDNVRF